PARRRAHGASSRMVPENTVASAQVREPEARLAGQQPRRCAEVTGVGEAAPFGGEGLEPEELQVGEERVSRSGEQVVCEQHLVAGLDVLEVPAPRARHVPAMAPDEGVDAVIESEPTPGCGQRDPEIGVLALLERFREARASHRRTAHQAGLDGDRVAKESGYRTLLDVGA